MLYNYACTLSYEVIIEYAHALKWWARCNRKDARVRRPAKGMLSDGVLCHLVSD